MSATLTTAVEASAASNLCRSLIVPAPAWFTKLIDSMALEIYWPCARPGVENRSHRDQLSPASFPSRSFGTELLKFAPPPLLRHLASSAPAFTWNA